MENNYFVSFREPEFEKTTDFVAMLRLRLHNFLINSKSNKNFEITLVIQPPGPMSGLFLFVFH